MLRSLPSQDKASCPKSEVPATLAGLRALTGVTELGHDLETLALLGTQFDDALFTTRNAAALMSDQGGYGALQGCEKPFRVSNKRVTFRFCRGATLSLARTAPDEASGLPGSLIALDDDGQVHHRVQFRSEADTQLAHSLGVEAPVFTAWRPNEAETLSNVVSLPAIRHAREHWDHLDAGSHLNDLIENGGTMRRNSLPHIGKERAWAIDPRVLPSFLEFLFDQREPFTRMVVAQGILHASAGRLDRFQTLGKLALCQSKRSTFSLDFTKVKEAWVIASRRQWQIELFDREENAVAVLAADPLADETKWRDYLASFPRLN